MPRQKTLSRSQKKSQRKTRRQISASRGLRKYWQQVKFIAKDRDISIPSAREFFRTVESTGRFRFDTRFVKSYKSVKKFGTAKEFDRIGRKIKRGKNKGRIKITIDTFKKKFITFKTASTLREKNKLQRIANVLLDRNQTEQHTIPKRFWSKRALKRHHLTSIEALVVAKKVLRARRKKNLADNIWQELFDES